MNPLKDGPASPVFHSLPLNPNITSEELASTSKVSEEMRSAAQYAPSGDCVSWGIPFKVNGFVLVLDQPVEIKLAGIFARWVVFMHTSDIRSLAKNAAGLIIPPMRGEGQLNEHAADYVLLYEDGTEIRLSIKRRHQLGAFTRRWGDNCFQAVEASKQAPLRANHEQPAEVWGVSQTRNKGWNYGPWVNWLWAFENPHPEKMIVGIRLEPFSGAIVLSGMAYGEVSEHPLRWRRRRKAILTLPEGETFNPMLDQAGLLKQLQLDLGQVISAQFKQIYPQEDWKSSYNNQVPQVSDREVIIEYTSHPDARFHLPGRAPVLVSSVESNQAGSQIFPIDRKSVV